ncbi:trypco2 family protein [Streptomyces sp. NPDC048448]|uniref:Trypco2 family protein n=1 Tax=Streptomyces kaempferi TaxID=333725 RepID=A0ABW3XJD0_9ACTN|nr:MULTISPECIES: trypco2 family protein [unclassified Streptomyces]
MIELAELIEELRRELTAARTAAEGEDLYFEVGPVELEAAVVVERSATAGGKIRFWVVEAGADGRVAEGVTHRVKLTLDPRTHSGGGRAPWVGGSEADRER